MKNEASDDNIPMHLKRGNTLLGMLNMYDSNWPWAYCRFEPMPAFEEIKPFIEAVEHAPSQEALQTAWQEYKLLNVYIEDLADGEIYKNYLLSLREDGDVYLREFDIV